MKTKHVFPIVTLFIFLSCMTAGQDNAKAQYLPVKKTADELDSYFNNLMAVQKYAGLGACLIKEGRIIWQGTYGYSDIESKKTLKENDIFLLCSLSKTVTATALMQLYEKGMFGLDEDVNKYLPFNVRNPGFPEKPITFRMLLTHTAGFADVTLTGNKINLSVTGDSDIPFDKYVEGLFTPGGKYYSTDYFSKNEPGTKHEYSNISFSLIGYLVERMTETSFTEYCREKIFKPLEMNSTGWHLRDLDTQRVVFPCVLSGTDTAQYRKVKHFGLPGYPEGMLRTNMHDFANFLSAFMNDGRYKDHILLKPATVKLMLSPQGLKNIPSRSFKIKDIGLLWLIYDVEGEELYSMNGFSPSFFSNAYFSTKDRTAIIYFYTGISMKNMMAATDITKKLLHSLKEAR